MANVNPRSRRHQCGGPSGRPPDVGVRRLGRVLHNGRLDADVRDSDGHATELGGRFPRAADADARVHRHVRRHVHGTWLVSNETWDTDNNLAVEVDPRGNETDYLYDPMGNTMAVGEPY